MIRVQKKNTMKAVKKPLGKKAMRKTRGGGAADYFLKIDARK